MSLDGGFEEVVESFFRRAISLSNAAIRAKAAANCSRKRATSASSRSQFGQGRFRLPMPEQHKDNRQNHLHQYCHPGDCLLA
jgi:hypothetical protein